MTLAVAFIAGLVSCLSPCVLPVVPVFAGYVAGGAGTAWSSSAAPMPVATASGSATWRAVGFLLGFLGVFVALVTGFLGSYTTFSSFAFETHQLIRDGDLARALAYILASNVAGLAAASIGWAVATRA